MRAGTGRTSVGADGRAAAWRRGGAVVVALGAGLLLAACSSPAPTTPDEPQAYDDAQAVADAFEAAGGVCDERTGEGEGPGLSSLECVAPDYLTMISVFDSHEEAEVYVAEWGPAMQEVGNEVVLGENWVILTPEPDAAVAMGGYLAEFTAE